MCVCLCVKYNPLNGNCCRRCCGLTVYNAHTPRCRARDVALKPESLANAYLMALYTLATPTHNVVAFSCVHYTGLKYQRRGLYSRTHLFFITYTPRGRKCAFVFSRQVLPLVAVVCLYCALSQGAEERLAGVGGLLLNKPYKTKVRVWRLACACHVSICN